MCQPALVEFVCIRAEAINPKNMLDTDTLALLCLFIPELCCYTFRIKEVDGVSEFTLFFAKTYSFLFGLIVADIITAVVNPNLYSLAMQCKEKTKSGIPLI